MQFPLWCVSFAYHKLLGLVCSSKDRWIDSVAERGMFQAVLQMGYAGIGRGWIAIDAKQCLG